MVAINWDFWTTKNDIVFNGKIWKREQIFELFHLKVALWMNAKWPGHNASISDLARFPNEGIAPIMCKK